MSQKKILIKAFLITLTLCVTFFLVPVAVFAAKTQNVEISSTIKIEGINAIWTDGNFTNITEIKFPEYIAPGESLNLNGGLYLKNEGTPAYGRFKPTILVNGVASDLVIVDIDSNWVLGDDGYYYYCNKDSKGQINKNQNALVVNDITFSDTFKNINSGDDISITFIGEFVETAENAWQTEWGSNPPQEWLDAIK